MTTLLHILFFFSGAAALGYQIIWARMFAAGLGHEFPSVLAVVCAFMGGMSVGGWALARRISISEFPARWYVALELTTALWSAVTAFLVPTANDLALRLIGLEPSPWRHWSTAFAIPFALLLPSTAALGATFAAMERWFRVLQARGVLSSVAPVYASNTAGAAAGTLVTAFVLMPTLGFRNSALALAAVSVACGVLALALGGRKSPPGLKAESIPVRTAMTIFWTGLLGIGYEVAAIRVLSTVLENTIYTFAVTLATFLLGTAVGSSAYHRYVRKGPTDLLTSRLLIWVAVACLASVWPLASSRSLYDGLRNEMGLSVIAEMTVALFVLLPPAVVMGMLFSHLVQTAAGSVAGVGRMMALNTLGAAIAPVVVGVMTFPAIGAKWTLAVMAFGYVALAPSWSALKWTPLFLGIAALSIIPANLKLLQIPANAKVIDFREGIMASVTVLEDGNGERTLRINGRFQQGGTAAANAEYRQAHIPLLLHSKPQTALFLGVGTGITLGAATLYPGLRVEGVELVPEVVDSIAHFDSASFELSKSSSSKLHVADARRYVRAATNRYDVIVADLFHPAMDGAGLLYTSEHFRAVRKRLAAGGLFCQWLPLYQLDESLVRVIANTFLGVFPEAEGWLLRFDIEAPVLGLVGWVSRPQYSAQWVEHRLTDSNLERFVRQLTLSESVRFFTHVLLDAPTLRAFGGTAPLNTDDMPRVIFDAPRVTHESTEPHQTLAALLQQPMPNPASIVSDSDVQPRLAAAWKARHRYLYGLIAEQHGREAEAIDAYVESARLSPDFTLGYARCATLASIRARSDPPFARQLLQRLIEAQPSQQLARDMLQRL